IVVSSTPMKVASMTEAAISQGLTPCAASADWSGGATAAEAMSFGTNPSCGSDSLLCRAKKGNKGCFFLREPLNCETKKAAATLLRAAAFLIEENSQVDSSGEVLG